MSPLFGRLFLPALAGTLIASAAALPAPTDAPGDGSRRGLASAGDAGSRSFPLPARLQLSPAARQTPHAGASLAVEELRERAREILAKVQALDLSLREARVLVERLRRDLKAVGEAEGWTPVARRLEIPLARPDASGLRIEEECPLFYEEELVQLCPLDLSRSEIWGSQVLVCGFACAPEPSGRPGRAEPGRRPQ